MVIKKSTLPTMRLQLILNFGTRRFIGRRGHKGVRRNLPLRVNIASIGTNGKSSSSIVIPGGIGVHEFITVGVCGARIGRGKLEYLLYPLKNFFDYEKELGMTKENKGYDVFSRSLSLGVELTNDVIKVIIVANATIVTNIVNVVPQVFVQMQITLQSL
ncbi:hypothetical protein C1645_807523 [Glomus cerebriforme]|uniref:Uncharacterized protein n=1 Tax=Glomus cerebriforme TaxID=658196 RepID=A0A397SMU8_9GLOM|nr:hypothetical protein C1645_807523 [Glomus cerebriforme]